MTRESLIEAISWILARADVARLRIVYPFALHVVR